MSNVIHCDGPHCEQTRVAGLDRKFCEAPWTRVEQGTDRYDFHSAECVAAWAAQEADPFKAADRNATTEVTGQ